MIINPLYLLADSQLLFLRDKDGMTARLRAGLTCNNPKAAYIGASNQDNRQFYDLFVAAMAAMDVRHCHMVPRRPADKDRTFLQEADLLLLAGGDVEHGWRMFEQNGLKDVISRKRYEGATLVGVSAGAIQLGLGTLTNATQPKILNLFGFAPFYVGTHAEEEEWFDLRVLVNLSQPGIRGVGIPSGGGAIYWPDGTLEPVRRPLVEFTKTNDQVTEGLLLPSETRC